MPPVIPYSYCSFGWPERYIDSNGTWATKILYVPKGTKEAYEAAPWWEHFETIIELEATDIEKINNDGIDSAQPVMIYNFNGMKVYSGKYSDAHLCAGSYIVVQNGKSSKITIK